MFDNGLKIYYIIIHIKMLKILIGTLLVGIAVAKSSAIAWSKVMGYRGGMAMAQFAAPNISIHFGIIFVLIGAFYTNAKTHIILYKPV